MADKEGDEGDGGEGEDDDSDDGDDGCVAESCGGSLAGAD